MVSLELFTRALRASEHCFLVSFTLTKSYGAALLGLSFYCRAEAPHFLACSFVFFILFYSYKLDLWIFEVFSSVDCVAAAALRSSSLVLFFLAPSSFKGKIQIRFICFFFFCVFSCSWGRCCGATLVKTVRRLWLEWGCSSSLVLKRHRTSCWLNSFGSWRGSWFSTSDSSCSCFSCSVRSWWRSDVASSKINVCIVMCCVAELQQVAIWSWKQWLDELWRLLHAEQHSGGGNLGWSSGLQLVAAVKGGSYFSCGGELKAVVVRAAQACGHPRFFFCGWSCGSTAVAEASASLARLMICLDWVVQHSKGGSCSWSAQHHCHGDGGSMSSHSLVLSSCVYSFDDWICHPYLVVFHYCGYGSSQGCLWGQIWCEVGRVDVQRQLQFYFFSCIVTNIARYLSRGVQS